LPAFTAGLEGKGWMEGLSAALNWVTSVGKPLLVGLPLLATLLALLGYFATDWAWRLGVMWQWRQRTLKRNRKAAP
jgi:uncharacterized protein